MKALLKSGVVLGLGLSGIVFAGGSDQLPTQDSKAFSKNASFLYDGLTDGFSVGLGIENQRAELNVTGSFVKNNPAGDSSEYMEYFVGGAFGVKHQLKSEVIGTLGVMGNYGYYCNNNKAGENGSTEKPYTVGAYLGLGYQPSDAIQIFVRIMPYSYEKAENNDKEIGFLNQGQVGIKYFF